MKTFTFKPYLLMLPFILPAFIGSAGCADEKGPSMQNEVDENKYFAPVKKSRGRNRSMRQDRNPEEFAKRRADMLLRNLDKDQDQTISSRELEGHRFAEQLMMADTDGNGMITKEELINLRPKRGSKRPGTKDKNISDNERISKYFAKYDTDKNGSITPDEAEKTRFGSRLMRADTDGDKKISQQEFDKAARDYYSRMRQGRGGRRGQQGRPGRGQGRGYRGNNQNRP